MTITIRNAVATDAAAIGNLAHEFQSYLRTFDPNADFDWGARQFLRDGFGDEPAFEGIVAEKDSEVIAFAIFHPGYDSDRGERLIYMTDLYVSASHRGSGVGKQLMKRIADVGRQRNVTWLAWSVVKGNHGAIRFYESQGAEYNDKLHHMYVSLSALT